MFSTKKLTVTVTTCSTVHDYTVRVGHNTIQPTKTARIQSQLLKTT